MDECSCKPRAPQYVRANQSWLCRTRLSCRSPGRAAQIGAPEQFCNVPIRLIIARSLNSSRRLSCICTPAGQINSFDRLTGTAVARATEACISDRFSATIYPSQSFTIEPKTHTLCQIFSAPGPFLYIAFMKETHRCPDLITLHKGGAIIQRLSMAMLVKTTNRRN